MVVEESMWKRSAVCVGVSYWRSYRAVKAEEDWNRPWCGTIPASERRKTKIDDVRLVSRSERDWTHSQVCAYYSRTGSCRRSLPRLPCPSQPKAPAAPSPRRLRAPHPSPSLLPYPPSPTHPSPRRPRIQICIILILNDIKLITQYDELTAQGAY